MIQRTKASAWTVSLIFALAATPLAAERPSFTTPSGNITCFLETGASELDMVCFIRDAGWEYPHDGADCTDDRFRAVTMGDGWPPRAITICTTDVFWPYPSPQISYGSMWSVDGFTCSVETDGVRCADPSENHRFHIAQAALNLR
ncbi:MAG: hypothetical protein AAGL89_10815 [Pseudomonadota bacterium]